MYKQLTSEQKSQILVLLQKKTSRKELAELVKSLLTLSRELKRNSTVNGHYLWKQAQEKSEERRLRATSNSKKDEIIIWEALEYLRREQWFSMQISGYMPLDFKRISHELIYQYIRADKSGELKKNCLHQMKYNRQSSTTDPDLNSISFLPKSNSSNISPNFALAC